jgi:hypothetical protein
MIHPHVCRPQHPGPQYPVTGPGAVDTINALSSLAMTTVHLAITAIQVIVNRTVWGDCPAPHADLHAGRCGCCHGYGNVRFHDHHHCR